MRQWRCRRNCHRRRYRPNVTDVAGKNVDIDRLDRGSGSGRDDAPVEDASAAAAELTDAVEGDAAGRCNRAGIGDAAGKGRERESPAARARRADEDAGVVR